VIDPRRVRRGAALTALLIPALALAADDAPRRPGPTEPGPALPNLAVPASWRPQPTLVAAARAAAATDAGPRPMSFAAWGDPVVGCFATAVTIGLRSADVATVAGQLRAALATAVNVEGWTDDAGVLAARLNRAGWQGALRGLISARSAPHATVVACFYNDRAPTRCQAACDALLASLPDGNLTNRGTP
jgi:hypothetical protein